MKYSGCKCDFQRERDDDLLRAYRQILQEFGKQPIRIEEVWQKLAEAPSKRFWVSEERAAVVVANMMKGQDMGNMKPQKRRMFLEIYTRVVNMREQYPQLSNMQLCAKAIHSPAPSFYLTPQSVKQIIYRIKRICYQERMKKLRHCF